MADEQQKFIVTTTEGVFRSGHPKEKDANYACEQANQAAEKLGIKTRYEVSERQRG